jgi:LacI family transcriptional regulator
MVCLDRIPDRVPVDSVSVEDEEAAEMGVTHLIERGARRIALATGPPALKNERRRLQGYKQALHKAGIPPDDSLIWQGNLRSGEVTDICRQGLVSPDVRPQAVFCTNGPTALGVLRALRDLGREIPRDIAFATFDELAVEDLFSPSITTVVQPAYDIGFKAAQILLDRIEGRTEDGTPITVRLPATLKVRESSKVNRE